MGGVLSAVFTELHLRYARLIIYIMLNYGMCALEERVKGPTPTS